MLNYWKRRSKREKRFVGALGVMLGLVVFLPISLIKGPVVGAVLTVILCASIFAFAFGYILIFLILIGVHEMGHILAGKLAGFTFNSMHIGPFLIAKTDEGMECKFSRDRFSISGLAIMDAPNTDNLAPRFACFIAGGPLASVLACVALYFLLPWRLVPTDQQTKLTLSQLLGNLISIIALYVSIALAALSVVPYRLKGMSTDCSWFLRLIFKKETPELLVAIFQFQNEMKRGLPSKEWSIPHLHRLCELTPKGFSQAQYMALLGHALIYRGSVDEGLEWLEASYEGLKAPMAQLRPQERAGYEDVAFARAHWKGDLEGAREALKRADDLGSEPTYGRYRALAAIALRQGDAPETIANANNAKAWLISKFKKMKPIHEACMDEMSHLIAKAQELDRKQINENLLVVD